MTGSKIALIPAYEPDERLLELLDALTAAGWCAIVVDDGSGEGCAPVFRVVGEKAPVLTHTENKGKGRALKTGFSYILERYGEDCTVVTMDCDGQHTIRDAQRLFEYAEGHPEALVLGSRGLKEGTPLRSRFGNGVTRLVYHLATGQNLHDTQTGLRAFRGSLLPVFLSIPGERYEYEMNVLLACARNKIPVAEKEIATIYFDNNSGSHFHTIRDSWRVYREILRFSLSSFLGFLTDYALYSLLLLLSGNLALSNVGARVVSASVNYTLNRTLVFRSRANAVSSALQYALLAAIILAGNTALLYLLVNGAGLSRWLAKLLAELTFFFLSWSVQHWIIFRKNPTETGARK